MEAKPALQHEAASALAGRATLALAPPRATLRRSSAAVFPRPSPSVPPGPGVKPAAPPKPGHAEGRCAAASHRRAYRWWLLVA